MLFCNRSNIFLLSVIVIAITGCGFKPLYSKQNASGICRFKGATIDSSNDIVSIHIRRHIENYLASCGNERVPDFPIRKMLVSSGSSEMGALYLKTGETTRKMIKVTAEVKLYDDKMSFIDTIVTDNYDSYNSLDTPFSEYVTSQHSLANAASGLANKIIIKLNRYSIR